MQKLKPEARAPDDADTMPRICRHVHCDGVRICLRYTMSDGTYVGEIDMAAAGGPTMWQTLAYDLLQMTRATAQGEAWPETGAKPVMRAN